MVIYHVGLPLPGGFVGVDVFFVISGFVITLALARDIDKVQRVRFFRFYGRRVRRLLPALALMVLVTLLLSAVLQSPFGAQRDTAAVAVGASTWSANLVLYVLTGDYFANAAESIPLLHTWSLAVEEQFYVVFPALIAFTLWISRRRKATWVACAGIVLVIFGALSFALSLYLSWGGGLPGIASPESAAFYSSPTRAWQFVAGALLALWFIARPSSTPRGSERVVGLLGVALLGLTLALVSSDDRFPGLVALLPTAATAMLIAGGTHLPLLQSRVMTKVGDLSYSWYLWHWPFIVFAELLVPGVLSKAIAAVLALGAAWAAYTWVEEPIRMRTPSRRGTLAIVAVCVLVPMVLSAGLFTASRAKWWNTDLQAVAQQVEPVPVGRDRGCHGFTPLSQRAVKCTFGSGEKRLILLGDSNGAQYAEAAVSAAPQLNARAILGTAPGCPFVEATFPSSGSQSQQCHGFVEDTLNWLDSQEPSVVVIANASENIEMPQVSMAAGDDLATTPATKEKLWRQGLEAALQRIRSAGHQPVLLSTSPHFGSPQSNVWWNPSSCLLPDLLNGGERCTQSVSLATADAQQSRALRAERGASETVDAMYVDVRSEICPDDTCSTRRERTWVYRDGLHLSTTFSQELAPWMVTQLQPAFAGK